MFEDNSWVDADYRAALSHIESDRLAEAEVLLRAVLAMDPNYAPAWFSLGTTLMRGSKYAEAADCFGAAASLMPDHADPLVNQAIALYTIGKSEDAAAALQQAAALNPEQVEIQAMLARALTDASQIDQAIAAADRAVALDSKSARAASAKGHVLRKLMRLEESATAYRIAVTLDPDFGDAWADLGTVLQAQQQTEAACEAYRRALSLIPGHFLAAINFSRLLLAHGKGEEARPLINRMLSKYDKHPDVLWLAAEQARFEGRLTEAIPLYERLLECTPDRVDALTGLGTALHGAGRFGEALARLVRVTELAPNAAFAWAQIGSLLIRAGHYDQGAVAYRNAVSFQPEQVAWLTSLGLVELNLGNCRAALLQFQRAATLQPNDCGAESKVLYALPLQADINSEQIKTRMHDFGARFSSAAVLEIQPSRLEPERPLRVGYLLPDMTNHPLQPFLEPLFSAHDCNRIELITYTSTPQFSDLPSSLAGTSSLWRFLVGATAQEIVDQMRRDEIDILVDVSAHRLDNRVDVMARRTAPVQLTWGIGTGLGTGLGTVDAVIGDDRLMPSKTEPLFVEEVLRPFAAYACYRGSDEAPAPNQQPASTMGYVTFGYLGRVARVNELVVRAWAKILNEVEGSRLLVDHGSLQLQGPQNYLRQRFAPYGIKPERIVAGFSGSAWDAWQKIDIALDPFPSSSGATILEGLWMGVPAVSLAGDLPSGRFGAAILPHVGLRDWVVESEEAYVVRAIAAAQDRARLAELRQELRGRLAVSPLWDARGFAAALEATYRDLWHRYCASH